MLARKQQPACRQGKSFITFTKLIPRKCSGGGIHGTEEETTWELFGSVLEKHAAVAYSVFEIHEQTRRQE